MADEAKLNYATCFEFFQNKLARAFASPVSEKWDPWEPDQSTLIRQMRNSIECYMRTSLGGAIGTNVARDLKRIRDQYPPECRTHFTAEQQLLFARLDDFFEGRPLK